MPNKPAEPSPEVAPTQTCRAKWQLNDKVQCDLEDGHTGDHEKHYLYEDERGTAKFYWPSTAPVPAVAPRETQTEPVLISVWRPEGYEDVCDELVAEDFAKADAHAQKWRYEVVARLENGGR